MEHFHVGADKIIKVHLTGVAGLLKPTIYLDGKYYCCLLGPNPEDGVFACGRTLQKALEAWNKQLKIHLNANDDEDYIIVI